MKPLKSSRLGMIGRFLMGKPKLTKHQLELDRRLRIYTEAKNQLIELRKKYEACSIETYGLCKSIELARIKVEPKSNFSILFPDKISNYPEIWKRRPKTLYKKNRLFWWSLSKRGFDRRMRVLDEAIEEVKESMKKVQ